MSERHQRFWPPGLPRELAIPQRNLAENLALAAECSPAHPAIVYYDTPLTYARVAREVELLAGYLERVAAVRPGDRVLLDLQNSPQFAIAYYAILRANAVVVPISPLLRASELELYLRDSGARVAIVGADVLEHIGPHVGALLERVVVATYSDYLERETDLTLPPGIGAAREALEVPAFVAWHRALAMGHAPGPCIAGSQDLALLPYTSGTTGRPKGCEHTHASLQAQALAVSWWRSNAAETVACSVLPFYHAIGMSCDLNAVLATGGTLVVHSRWDAATVVRSIERHRCSALTSVGAMIVDLLREPTFVRERVGSLERVGGGSPLPSTVAARLESRLGLSYIEGYGLTETLGMTHANPPDRGKRQSLGIPTFGVDARIVLPGTFEELGPDQLGEIAIAGPSVMRRYWRRPELDAEAFFERDGRRFFRTGDLGKSDDDGYFFLVDRLKRMITCSGLKLWPAEIEGRLMAHPAVREACVVAAHDARRGETPKAFVVLREGARTSGEELAAWARAQMASYKVPTEFAIVVALPRAATDRVDWRLLQEQQRASDDREQEVPAPV